MSNPGGDSPASGQDERVLDTTPAVRDGMKSTYLRLGRESLIDLALEQGAVSLSDRPAHIEDLELVTVKVHGVVHHVGVAPNQQ